LVHLRRGHHFFPIRPYLPLLVSALEDSDARVRECARESVVELYTGPGVTDAARADLKTAMAKKNVRKGIVESILSKLVSGSGPAVLASPQSEGSEDGNACEDMKDFTPPSLMIQGQKTIAGAAVGQRTQADVKEPPRPLSRSGTLQPSDAAGTPLADVRPVYVCT
jgi:CLIP-associating protein 1/2